MESKWWHKNNLKCRWCWSQNQNQTKKVKKKSNETKWTLRGGRKRKNEMFLMPKYTHYLIWLLRPYTIEIKSKSEWMSSLTSCWCVILLLSLSICMALCSCMCMCLYFVRVRVCMYVFKCIEKNQQCLNCSVYVFVNGFSLSTHMESKIIVGRKRRKPVHTNIHSHTCTRIIMTGLLHHWCDWVCIFVHTHKQNTPLLAAVNTIDEKSFGCYAVEKKECLSGS